MIDKFKEAFTEEATELLGKLEATLLELEEHPHDSELISSVFRTMHTIKGSSSMFGFDEISAFTHEVESVMDMLREGVFTADRKLIDLTLQARDLISAMLPGTTKELENAGKNLVAQFQAYIKTKGAEQKSGHKNRKGASADKEHTAVKANKHHDIESDLQDSPLEESFRIHFLPSLDIFKNGTKPLLLLQELQELGVLQTIVLSGSIPPLSAMDPEQCYVGWEMVLKTNKGIDAVKDVFIFIEDSCELEIVKINTADTALDVKVKRLGEILVERGITTEDKLRQLDSGRKRIGELLVEEKIASPEQIKSALAEQEHLRKMKEKQELGTSSIRVPSERLDALVDLVGELVTLQARMARTAQDLEDSALISISEQFERLMAQLRDNTMNIRMLPIGSTFSRFRRVVRDLSAELGKEIELRTEGAETELDKTVIEKLNDPLVHIIRNSIDHGIEAPEKRKAAGKPESGVVTLSAMHSGAYVQIKISDDGAGLNTERIYEKAVERGIVAQGTNLSEQELFHLIFEPGFSTAQKVTSVSGRGVGMDVVKRQIDGLGGLISIDSAVGRGTTISLKIPLTLAIIEGLLIRMANEYYVIPLSVVDGCIEIKKEEKNNSGTGRNILSYRNELLPYVSIRKLFDIPEPAPDIEQIVVVNALDSRIGFIVDQVIGDNQTVIKPLGRMFKNSEGLSGATILGDGTVALIIDVNRLAASAQKDELLNIQQEKHGS